MADTRLVVADFFPPGSCRWHRISKKKRPATWFCLACRAFRKTFGAMPGCAGTEDRARTALTPKDNA